MEESFTIKDISISAVPKNKMGWPKGRPSLGRVKKKSKLDKSNKNLYT